MDLVEIGKKYGFIAHPGGKGAPRAAPGQPGWQPDRTDANLRSEAGHPADWLSRELERFRDYWKAKTGKDATKIDWNATWRNWIRNARPSAPNSRSPPSFSSTAKPGQTREDYLAAERRRSERSFQ